MFGREFNMPYNIWNRRYTGSKYKLSDWIIDLINENCEGTTFCDLFAGTGIISAKMLSQISELYINDFLFSNEIIYKAFFEDKEFSNKKLQTYKARYLSIDASKLKGNYVSNNFGDKFFSKNDAKVIGYIREDIEENSSDLNNKEKSILIASLLYSMDKAANTVGHYDAYIKGHTIEDSFIFDLINPYDSKGKSIHISRRDANELVKKSSYDIVYIDPPYNSRQYSRFYHVLENITQWKKPILFGEALKPQPENMSEYCRSSATVVFKDLINNLKCNYIVVSYNNTYKSKSSSSKNKITLEDIESILKEKGKLLKFEKPYQAFNAGKTNFDNHKELIYIVKVGNKHVNSYNYTI